MRHSHWLAAFLPRAAATIVATTSLAVLTACSDLTDETFKLDNVAIGQRSASGALVDDENSVPGLAADAKSRFIWAPSRPVRELLPGLDNKEGLETRHVQERQILCAEPSPDALVTYSTALSTALRGEIVGQGSVSGELSRSLAETGRVLGERTPTIQLLRDNLYRACESYANGVVDNFGYALILNKIDDLMVTLVAVEALGRGTLKDEDTQLVNAAITAEEELQAVSLAVPEANRRLSEANNRVTSLTGQATTLSADKARADTAQTIATADADTATGASTQLAAAREKSSEFGAQIAAKEGEIAAQENILADESRKDEHAAARTAITQRQAEIRGLEGQKNQQDREIVRLEGLAGGSSSANARQTAAASEAAALDARLTAVNEQLTLANTEKAAAVADVAKARVDLLAAQGKSEGARRQAGSVRPTLGEQERNQIERIVQREQTDSNPSTVVGACFIWFAQHPSFRAGGQSNTTPAAGAPAIAHYCSRFIDMSIEASKARARSGPTPLIGASSQIGAFADADWIPAVGIEAPY